MFKTILTLIKCEITCKHIVINKALMEIYSKCILSTKFSIFNSIHTNIEIKHNNIHRKKEIVNVFAQFSPYLYSNGLFIAEFNKIIDIENITPNISLNENEIFICILHI